MPYNSSGVFVNVAGATSAATGQIIQSTVWNNIHADYSLALNEVMGQLISMPSNRNLLWMNGGLEVWQRGAGAVASIPVSAGNSVYTADRWYIMTGANQASIVSAQAGLIDESQLCARVQRNSGQTGTGGMIFAYPFDTDEIIRARGNIVTLTCRVRAGANWSPTSGTLLFALFSGTGASLLKRNFTPFTGDTTIISGSTNLTPGGATVAVTVTSAVIVPANATQLELQFFWDPVGTAGASDYFEIDDVQIEMHLPTGDYVPTAFDRLPFNVMLEACKRHYQKSFVYNSAPQYGNEPPDPVQHLATATTLFRVWAILPVELRASANFTAYSPATATSSAWYNATSTSTSIASFIGGETKRVTAQVLATATAIDNLYTIHYTASAGI